MSNQVEGVVWKVYTKNFRGRDNYTVKLDGIPTYFRLGTNRHAGVCEEGNKITFSYEENPDGQSARVTSDPRIVQAQAPAAQTAGPTGGSPRQAAIEYQSSRKDALEFLRLTLTSGAVTLPAAKGKKLVALEALLDRYTAQFFEDVATLGAVVREAANPGDEEVESASEEGEDDE